jgi:hypothetical protein
MLTEDLGLSTTVLTKEGAVLIVLEELIITLRGSPKLELDAADEPVFGGNCVVDVDEGCGISYA